MNLYIRDNIETLLHLRAIAIRGTARGVRGVAACVAGGCGKGAPMGALRFVGVRWTCSIGNVFGVYS